MSTTAVRRFAGLRGLLAELQGRTRSGIPLPLVDAVRQEVESIGWRAAIEEALRSPHTARDLGLEGRAEPQRDRPAVAPASPFLRT